MELKVISYVTVNGQKRKFDELESTERIRISEQLNKQGMEAFARAMIQNE